ncbi:MAG: hypothetical protein M1830_001437 [Pleopsidium flavum]|nr:MAG: hypothetical protein M1830_001437 [Pleopsidium flavum]
MATGVDAKLLKQTKFPPEFNQKVDMKKVNVEVMKKWIAGKISEILGNEDDVVIELCFNLLEGARFPDIKVLQIQLTGFLDKDTARFCKELWTLCLSAQSNPQGVPKELLEAKKLELIQEKIDAEKAAEEARRRKEQERVRDRDIDSIRQRERGERGRGRGRGGRGGRDFDRRPPRDSRSPPPRRRGSPDRSDYRGPPPRREVDTYIPGGRGGRRLEERRRRSPSPPTSVSRSRSRSASPYRRRPRNDDEPRPNRRRNAPSVSRSPSPRRRGSREGRRRTPDREELEGDLRLFYHVAVHHLLDQDIIDADIARYQGQGLIEIEGVLSDQEDYIPTVLMMRRIIHALILTRTENVAMPVMSAEAEVESRNVLVEVQAEAEVQADGGKERDIDL